MIDSETKKVMEKGKALKDLVQSEGWAIVKQMFVDRIMDYQSVMNVVGATPDEVIVDIKARKTVVRELTQILKEVESTAEQIDANVEQIKKEESSFILRVKDLD